MASIDATKNFRDSTNSTTTWRVYLLRDRRDFIYTPPEDASNFRVAYVTAPPATDVAQGILLTLYEFRRILHPPASC